MEFVSDLVRKLKPHMAEMINGLVTGAVKFALLHVDGDVLIEGAARKIRGDFHNATLANRVNVQTSALNQPTGLAVIPNGAAEYSSLGAFARENPDNSEMVLAMITYAAAIITSYKTGAAASVPLLLQQNLTTILELTTSKELNLTPANRVFLKNCGSQPADTPSGGGYLFVQNGALKYKGSSGTVTTIAAA